MKNKVKPLGVISFFLPMIGLRKLIFAYIGPGLGLSAIGAFIAVFAAIITSIFGLIWYPLKKFFTKNKEDQEPDQVEDEE